MPYRRAGARLDNPISIEANAAIEIVRYPLLLQIYVLSWMPLAALGLGEAQPAARIRCERAAPGAEARCELRRSGLVRRSRAEVSSVHVREHEKGFYLVVQATDGSEEFAYGIDPRSLRDRIVAFQTSTEPGSLELRARSTWWFYPLAAAGTLAGVAIYRRIQRRMRFEFDREAGTIRMETHARSRPTEVRTVKLDEVDKFELVDLDKDGYRRAVEVVPAWGSERSRLFEAINVETRTALDFLEASLETWRAAKRRAAKRAETAAKRGKSDLSSRL